VSNPIRLGARMPGVRVRLVLAMAACALLGGAGAARADNPVLTGDVGLNDGFTLTLEDASGSLVKHLDPGTYTLVVHDHSAFHNFHLSGPGNVDVSTTPDFIGDQTFTVTLVDGQYFIQCDPHSSQMKGNFTVGAFTAPPPPPKPAPAAKLAASFGPAAGFKLAGAAGLSAGKAVVTVTDKSAKDGFRLSGPGVSKSTGAAFKGTVTWTVTLKAGTYTYGSAKRAKQRRSFTVSA
jgi:plastocyanin